MNILQHTLLKGIKITKVKKICTFWLTNFLISQALFIDW